MIKHNFSLIYILNGNVMSSLYLIIQNYIQSYYKHHKNRKVEKNLQKSRKIKFKFYFFYNFYFLNLLFF